MKLAARLFVLAWLAVGITARAEAYNPTTYVQHLYQDILGRTPTPGETNQWVSQLYSGLTPVSLASSMLGSKEKHLNEIRFYVQWLLKREAIQADYADGMRMYRGGETQESLISYICSSPEYAYRAGNTAYGVANALYQDLLFRAPSANEAQWVFSQFQMGRTGDAAYAILTGDESRTNLVASWYRGYLGRAADAPGLQSWLNVLRSGATRETAQAGILSSPEYLARP